MPSLKKITPTQTNNELDGNNFTNTIDNKINEVLKNDDIEEITTSIATIIHNNSTNSNSK